MKGKNGDEENGRKIVKEKGFPVFSAVKNPPANAGNIGSIPG